jgi:hypothetical protein
LVRRSLPVVASIVVLLLSVGALLASPQLRNEISHLVVKSTGAGTGVDATSGTAGIKLVFADDFETGDGSKWDRSPWGAPPGSTPTRQPVVDTLHPHSGNYSADFSTVYRSQKNLKGARQVWIATFWLYIPSGQSPATGGARVLALAPYDGTHPTGYVGLGLHEDYTVRLDNGMYDVGVRGSPAGPPLSLDTWHFVQIQARYGTPGRATLAIDGNILVDGPNDFTVSDDPMKKAAMIIMGRFTDDEPNWFIDDIQVMTAPDFQPADMEAAAGNSGQARVAAVTGTVGSGASASGASATGTGGADPVPDPLSGASAGSSGSSGTTSAGTSVGNADQPGANTGGVGTSGSTPGTGTGDGSSQVQVVFADDFEGGNGSKWNPPQPTTPVPTLQPIVDTLHPHSGKYSADFGAVYRSQKNLAGSPRVWIATFWLYIPSGQTPTDGGAFVLSLAPYDGTHPTGYVGLGLHEDYTVRLDNGMHDVGPIEGPIAPPLSRDAWHLVEIQARFGAPGRAVLAVDGNVLVDASNDFTVSDDPLKTAATVIMGRFNDNETKWFIDDIQVSTAPDFQPIDPPAASGGAGTQTGMEGTSAPGASADRTNPGNASAGSTSAGNTGAGGTATGSTTTSSNAGSSGSTASSAGTAASAGNGSAAVTGATTSAAAAIGNTGSAGSDGSVSSTPGSAATPGDPISQGQAIHLWATVDNNNGLQSIGGYAALQNYAAVRFQNWLFDEGQNPQQQARNANPSIKIFFYDVPHLIYTWQADYSTINSHEDWFAHDSSGNRIPGGDQNAFKPDATNPAYRAYRISHVLSYINQYNLDGFFWDGPPIDDNNSALWSQFMKEFKAALGQKLMIVNTTPPGPGYYPDVDNAYLQIADGTNMEVLDYSGTNYEWWRQMYQRNVSEGKLFVLSSGTQDHHKQMAMYALHLMFFDQGGYFDTQDVDFPELHIPLGNPVGPPRQQGTVWTRQFASATVTVDVNSGDASIQPLP